MPNRTLYYGKRDTPVWDAAERYAKQDGTSLSRLVTDLLERHLPELVTEADPHERQARFANIAADAA